MKRDEILTKEDAMEIIEELYRKHYRIADGMIEGILGKQLCKEDREDVVQMAFLRLIYNAESLIDRSDGERYSYLCSSVRSCAIDVGRKLSRMKQVNITEVVDCEMLAAMDVYGLTPEEQYLAKEEWSETSARLGRALAKLPRKDYDLLMARYEEELSDRAIGKKLGIKESFVRVYVNRARKRAANHYREELEAERAR